MNFEDFIKPIIQEAANRAADAAVRLYAKEHQPKECKYGSKMTPKQVCSEAGWAMQTLYQKKCNGQIPGAVKIGGKLLFETEIVLPWIQAGCPSISAK